MILWTLCLALLWALATEQVTPANLLVGSAVGFVILAVFGAPLGGPLSLVRVVRGVRLLGYFLIQLVLANLKMAYLTVMPLSRISPGIVAVALEPMSEGSLMLLANLITLTPGTLSVEVSPDRRTLYVHAMDVGDPAALVREIKGGFERRVLEVME